MNGRQLSEILGVSEATVSRLASGARKPSTALMVRIRDAFGGWSVNQQVEALAKDRYPQEFADRMAKRRAPKSKVTTPHLEDTH